MWKMYSGSYQVCFDIETALKASKKSQLCGHNKKPQKRISWNSSSLCDEETRKGLVAIIISKQGRQEKQVLFA